MGPRRRLVIFAAEPVVVAALLLSLLGLPILPPRSATFSQSAKEVEAYDFAELTADVSAPTPSTRSPMPP